MAAANRRRVLVIQPLHPQGMQLLEQRADVEIVMPATQERAELERLIGDVEAVAVRLTRIDAGLLELAPRLRIVSRHGVGVDNIDVAAATQAGIVVSVVGEANAPSVAEHTLAMMLALAKRLPDLDRAVRAGDYQRKMRLEAIDIAGRVVLIVGLGRIGRRVARACGALGMHCLGIDPAYTPTEIAAMGCAPVANLDAALPVADFVTLHCPLQDDTRGLIGARELALMKPSAYVVNCARGGIVDEPALLAALGAGRLMGAGLDVQVTEPPRADDPLLACDRIILSPHSAATTAEGMVRMARATAQNILDHFDGRLPSDNVFNPAVLAHARG